MATKLKNYEKKAMRNKHFLSTMKTERKKYLILKEKNEQTEAVKAFSKLDSLLQKLKSKGVIHKNKASRMISRLAKK